MWGPLGGLFEQKQHVSCSKNTSAVVVGGGLFSRLRKSQPARGSQLWADQAFLLLRDLLPLQDLLSCPLVTSMYVLRL